MTDNNIDRRALHSCTYGIYVITSRDGERRNGQIANTVFQVTSEPPRIAVAVNKENYTHELIEISGMLAVSVLEDSTPVGFIGRLGFRTGRETDKLSEVKYVDGVYGMPCVTEHSLSFFECRVLNSMDTGTHTLFLAELVSAEVLRKGNPITYADYRAMKGRAPGTAPVSDPDIVDTEKKGDTKMRKYVCQVCGYVYDPDEGDPDGGIEPGTPFEDIPDDWVCPVCGASKDQFEPE